MSFLFQPAWAADATWDEKSPHYISKREVPPEFDQAFKFLEFIKAPGNSTSGAFEPNNAPKWDVKKFMSYISSHGVRFTDVNDNSKRQESHQTLQSEISQRKGKTFRTFAHLSHIYSIPYKHYSGLTFEKRDANFVVNVSDWYRLSFISEKGSLVLAKCEYLQSEGE